MNKTWARNPKTTTTSASAWTTSKAYKMLRSIIGSLSFISFHHRSRRLSSVRYFWSTPGSMDTIWYHARSCMMLNTDTHTKKERSTTPKNMRSSHRSRSSAIKYSCKRRSKIIKTSCLEAKYRVCKARYHYLSQRKQN